MSALLLLIPACTTVLLDLALFADVRLLGGQPSATVALIACWSVLRPQDESLILAPVAGLLFGLVGNEPLGTSILALAPVIILSTAWSSTDNRSRLPVAIAVAAAGSAVYVLLSVVVGGTVQRSFPRPIDVLGCMVGTSLLTAPLTALVYFMTIPFAAAPHRRGRGVRT